MPEGNAADQQVGFFDIVVLGGRSSGEDGLVFHEPNPNGKPRPQLTDAGVDQVFRWVEEGRSRQWIADEIGVPLGALFDRTRESRGRGKLAHPLLTELPQRQGKNGSTTSFNAARSVDPSPTTIAATCANIQSAWTPEEMMRRTRGRLPDTYIPQYRTG